jgi:hypothetical protein
VNREVWGGNGTWNGRRHPNRSNPTGQINGWNHILNALTIHYGDRIEDAS